MNSLGSLVELSGFHSITLLSLWVPIEPVELALVQQFVSRFVNEVEHSRSRKGIKHLLLNLYWILLYVLSSSSILYLGLDYTRPILGQGGGGEIFRTGRGGVF